MKPKVHKISQILKEMRVGEPYLFSTKEPGKDIEVERIFQGVNEAWIIRFKDERLVTKSFDETVQFIGKYYGIELRKIVDQQFSELDKIIDLGEF